MAKRAALLGALMVVWFAACYWVRYTYIEVDWLVNHCAAHAQEFVCVFRAEMGEAMYLNYPGYAAIALALPAVFVPGRAGLALAVVGLLAAAVALSFYNASFGAPAAVLALLRLVRDVPSAAPRPTAG